MPAAPGARGRGKLGLRSGAARGTAPGRLLSRAFRPPSEGAHPKNKGSRRVTAHRVAYRVRAGSVAGANAPAIKRAMDIKGGEVSFRYYVEFFPRDLKG